MFYFNFIKRTLFQGFFIFEDSNLLSLKKNFNCDNIFVEAMAFSSCGNKTAITALAICIPCTVLTAPISLVMVMPTNLVIRGCNTSIFPTTSLCIVSFFQQYNRGFFQQLCSQISVCQSIAVYSKLHKIKLLIRNNFLQPNATSMYNYAQCSQLEMTFSNHTQQENFNQTLRFLLIFFGSTLYDTYKILIFTYLYYVYSQESIKVNKNNISGGKKRSRKSPGCSQQISCP